MAIFEWRTFNFFDLKKNIDNGKIAEALQEATITSATNGNNQIILCDSNGFIHVCPKNWDLTSFQGHDGPISLCGIALQTSFLVTIGIEESDMLPVFKVWNLSKLTKEGAPCIRTVKTPLQKPTALGVADGGQYMAIGFDRGSIALYRGDIGRDRTKNYKSLSAGTTTITGISFNMLGKTVQMFVCCDSGVLVYQLQSRDRENKIVLDNMCAPTRCCAIQPAHGQIESTFMVGRDDAIYCYTSDGKGPCYALDDEKIIIQWHRSHLLAICKPSKNAMFRQKDSVLTVIDVQNKFIVFQTPINQVVSIITEFGTCFIITRNREIYHLDEKDLQNKLKLLLKKNMYDIAVRIAKNNQYESEGLAEIFKQYGDHLYNKCDYTGSVDQYIKTIGYLEPSYVIRKFLDSRYILCLTDYLQAIHQQGKATADHTTLLLNCFTRLDRTDQLKEFLKNDANPDVLFDLDVAIKVCRNASIDDALALAKRNNKHDFVVSILTEDMQKYKEALEYIAPMNYSESEKLMKKYGYVLMENSPNETTEMFKKMCTAEKTALNSDTTNNEFALFDDINSEGGNPEDYFHMFIKYPENLINFLEHLVANLPKCNEIVYNTLVELYLKQWTTDKTVEEKVIKVLKNYDEMYDKNHTLILCRNYEFWPGILLLYEEQKLYHLIVRYHLKNGDYAKLLSTCQRLGANQPSLWLQAMTGLRNDKKAPPNLLSQILQVIVKEKLQSPLQVLNCVAIDNGPNLGTVRDYFTQIFQKETELIKTEEEHVEKCRSNSTALKAHIKKLRDETIEFRSSSCGTCHQPLTQPALFFLCQHSFHQDCVREYSESDHDCPMCQTKNKQLQNALHAQSEARGQHEIFHNLLDRSSEPFSVVAEYFGRALFNKIMIFNEEDVVIPQEQNTFIEQSNHNVNIPSAIRNKADDYGPGGAEGRLRMTEIKSQVLKEPVSEGRIRAQEHIPSLYTSTGISEIRKGPSYIRPQVQKAPAKTISQTISNRSTNPFDTDGDNASYDESKNPFSDDSDYLHTTNKKSLDNYDNNLNPFA